MKFATYFDHLGGANGALRLVPGSHYPEQHARLVAYRDAQMPINTDAEAAAYQTSIPGYVADTAPGDVIAFDVHTWHASAGGRDRLAWTIIYQRCPETDTERERTLASMHDGFEQAFRGFDRELYPIWRDWLADAGPILSAHPSSSGCGPPACSTFPARRSAGEIQPLDEIAIGGHRPPRGWTVVREPGAARNSTTHHRRPPSVRRGRPCTRSPHKGSPRLRA